MSFDRATSVGYLASLLSRRLSAALQQALEPLGLTPAQFAVLLELDGADGLSQRDLAVRLRVEQPSMAQTVTRLRRDGFVHQAAHESDRRSSRLWLTDKARGVLPTATDAAARINEQALRSLTPDQAEEFIKQLRRLVEQP